MGGHLHLPSGCRDGISNQAPCDHGRRHQEEGTYQVSRTGLYLDLSCYLLVIGNGTVAFSPLFLRMKEIFGVHGVQVNPLLI